MRIRNKSWITSELAENKALVRDSSGFKGKWREYFGSDCENASLYVEIGCGKGGYAAKTAASNPGVCYAAIERSPKIAAYAVKRHRLLDDPPKNLTYACFDADDICDWFSAGEIDRIYINFCDPWPNRLKWEKRRLTHRKYLEVYKGLLKPGGEIFFKTDNAELFEFSVTEFTETGWALRNISRDLHGEDAGKYSDHMTEYEEKFSGQGVKINRLEAVAPLGGDN